MRCARVAAIGRTDGPGSRHHRKTAGRPGGEPRLRSRGKKQERPRPRPVPDATAPVPAMARPQHPRTPPIVTPHSRQAPVTEQTGDTRSGAGCSPSCAALWSNEAANRRSELIEEITTATAVAQRDIVLAVRLGRGRSGGSTCLDWIIQRAQAQGRRVLIGDGTPNPTLAALYPGTSSPARKRLRT